MYKCEEPNNFRQTEDCAENFGFTKWAFYKYHFTLWDSVGFWNRLLFSGTTSIIEELPPCKHSQIFAQISLQ